MKRLLTILFTALLLAAALCVTASASDYDAVAEDLSAIGMFRGTANGFELDRAPTRSEAAIMLVRLYGAEDTAKTAYAAGEISHPFTDVSEFTSPYVAWLYSNGITNGFTATTYASQRTCSAQNYVVFLLRALGYKDGTDFQYAEALDFAVLKGLFDTSFYTGEFLRDDLAAVTYQALACNLADGSTYLLDSLIDSGAIDAKAAKPITDKIETYRTLTKSTMNTIQNSLDADIAMKINMGMNMSGTSEGYPVDMDAAITVDATGAIQMILEGDLAMGVQLDMNMGMEMTDVDGSSMAVNEPMSTGLWIKDNWVYIQSGETMYKADLDDSMSEFLSAYQEIMTQVSQLSDTSSAMMMPYLDEITSKKSGGTTVYTITLNNGAFMGVLDDILGMAGTSLGEELAFGLDMDLKDCTYTYTVSGGKLKSMTVAMAMTMQMDMSEGEESFSCTITADADMEMKVNATGKSVRVDYPDLSKFPDIDSIIVPEPSANETPATSY